MARPKNTPATAAYLEYARARDARLAVHVAAVERCLAEIATLEAQRVAVVASGATALTAARDGGLGVEEVASFLRLDVAELAVFGPKPGRPMNGRRDPLPAV
jgi:hypothetical protein